jgi:hypothetical protein
MPELQLRQAVGTVDGSLASRPDSRLAWNNVDLGWTSRC